MIKNELGTLVENRNVPAIVSIVDSTECNSREDIERKRKELESQIQVAVDNEEYDLADILLIAVKSNHFSYKRTLDCILLIDISIYPSFQISFILFKLIVKYNNRVISLHFSHKILNSS